MLLSPTSLSSLRQQLLRSSSTVVRKALASERSIPNTIRRQWISTTRPLSAAASAMPATVAAEDVQAEAVEEENNNNIKDDSKNGKTESMNLFTAINNAMEIALRTDDSAILFGEDVAFGGVFRTIACWES